MFVKYKFIILEKYEWYSYDFVWFFVEIFHDFWQIFFSGLPDGFGDPKHWSWYFTYWSTCKIWPKGAIENLKLNFHPQTKKIQLIS